MGWLSNLFGGKDDDDDDKKFVPGPGFYNVSQTPVPVRFVKRGDGGDYFETERGNVIKVKPKMSAGAACNPQDVVTDWGNYDEDYTKDEQASSWENTDVDTPIEVEFVAVNLFDRIFGNS